MKTARITVSPVWGNENARQFSVSYGTRTLKQQFAHKSEIASLTAEALVWLAGIGFTHYRTNASNPRAIALPQTSN